MISTRGRYAIRIMLDLAENASGSPVPMKDVAKRQEISLKYIEKIMPLLTSGGLVSGTHGKGGGYRLCREPYEYTIWEILTLAEGDMAPVACLSAGCEPCTRAAECRTLPMWEGYYNVTKDYFSNITLRNLMANPSPDNYVI